jgi:hypothetical protein
MRKLGKILIVTCLVGAFSAPAQAQSLFPDPAVEPEIREEDPVGGEEEEEAPTDEEVTPPFLYGPEVGDIPVSVTYPPYRVRYLADLIDRDRDGERLIEEGVFNTVPQANEVINILAHLTIAGLVDCSCEEYRRDAINALILENQMMALMRDAGYISRLVPASEVGSLPPYVRVLTPYLILNGDGYRDSNYAWYGSDPDRGWWGGGPSSSTVLNPSDPRQYARVDFSGVFVDTRLSSHVRARVDQLMGGYRVDDRESLCAFAALDRPISDMMSWVLIRDERSTWSGRIAPAE